MKRLLPWLAALFLGAVSNAQPVEAATAFDRSIDLLHRKYEEAQAKRSPREALEMLGLMAALSMLHVLETEGRYEPLPAGELRSEDERWLYSGDRVARVSVDEFPAYFGLLEYQSEIGMMVGVPDEELDRKLAGRKLPRELVTEVAELVQRARRAPSGASAPTR